MEENILNLISQSKILFQALWAFLVFLIGWFLAKWFGKGVSRFLDRTKLNQALKRVGVEEVLAKIDTRLNAPKFFGEMARWFLMVIVLMICAEIFGLTQFSQFLSEKVFGFFFNLLIAVLIFIIAVFLSDFSQKIFLGSFEKGKIVYSRILGKGLSYVIWTLAILAILYQLQIAQPLVLAIFIGVITLIVVVLGIAFGFGAKELAAKIIKEWEEKLK